MSVLAIIAALAATTYGAYKLTPKAKTTVDEELIPW